MTGLYCPTTSGNWPKMQKFYDVSIFYSSIDPVWLILWLWNLVSWYNLSYGVCWYIVCCHSPTNSAKISKNYGISERSIFQKQNQFFVFCREDMIANKMFFQTIYWLLAFWFVCVLLSRLKIEQQCNILIISAFFGQL